MTYISGLILLSSHFPLSTLRDRVSPVVTQDSLPAGDLSLAGQGSNLQGSYEWFLHLLLHLLPPSTGLSWRTSEREPRSCPPSTKPSMRGKRIPRRKRPCDQRKHAREGPPDLQNTRPHPEPPLPSRTTSTAH